MLGRLGQAGVIERPRAGRDDVFKYIIQGLHLINYYLNSQYGGPPSKVAVEL